MPLQQGAIEHEYNTVKHASLQWPRQNSNQGFPLTKVTHISPSRASYGMSIVSILEKTDPVIMAPHCIYFSRVTDCAFNKQVLTNLISRISADPKVSVEPVCILSGKLSTDTSWISWDDGDQWVLTLTLLPNILFCRQINTKTFIPTYNITITKQRLFTNIYPMWNGCHLVKNGKGIHFYVWLFQFVSDTNWHCDVTVESPCAQPWKPFKGPMCCARQRHCSEKNVALNCCRNIKCCTTMKIITVKLLFGHFIC